MFISLTHLNNSILQGSLLLKFLFNVYGFLKRLLYFLSMILSNKLLASINPVTLAMFACIYKGSLKQLNILVKNIISIYSKFIKMSLGHQSQALNSLFTSFSIYHRNHHTHFLLHQIYVYLHQLF